MATVAINITGPTNKSRSVPLSSQITKNFYPEKQDETGNYSDYVLHSFPGHTQFGTANGIGRGMFAHNNVLYRVCSTTLYSIDEFGAHTSLGAIAGNARCVFTPIKASFVIITGGVVYHYNVATSTLSTVTDVDLETPNSAAFLNNQIIYDGDEDRFVVSDVGDATSIDGLNYATAEVNSDDLVIPYSFDQRLYLMGDNTIETWWNSGVGSPPFDRLEGGIMPVGLAAKFSAAHNDKFLYFLSDDARVYRIQGTQYQTVSSIALSHAIEAYGTISDAIGFTFTIEGQNFYFLTFPREGDTWCYSESASDWFSLSEDTGSGRHAANSYAYIYRKHLFEDYRNGDIFEWSNDVYSGDGDEIQRVRTTGPLHGGDLGAPGKHLEISRFEILMETGVGLITGQGSDPKVMLQTSNDGGRTWSVERWGRIGKMGEYQLKVEWHSLGTFQTCMFRVKISDPVRVSIYSAVADIRVGI